MLGFAHLVVYRSDVTNRLNSLLLQIKQFLTSTFSMHKLATALARQYEVLFLSRSVLFLFHKQRQLISKL